jgi:hypothetical protein
MARHSSAATLDGPFDFAHLTMRGRSHSAPPVMARALQDGPQVSLWSRPGAGIWVASVQGWYAAGTSASGRDIGKDLNAVFLNIPQ